MNPSPAALSRANRKMMTETYAAARAAIDDPKLDPMLQAFICAALSQYHLDLGRINGQIQVPHDDKECH